jgi:Flp pilus assembly protein TadD
MHPVSFPKNNELFRFARILALAGACAGLLATVALPSLAQDSSAESGVRGNRPELSITLRDGSGEPIAAAGTVKVYRNGVPAGQSPSHNGRAFFILDNLGDYTILADATGYQSGRQDVSLTIAIKAEVDIVLKRTPGPNETSGVPGKAVLAPKAKDALEKGLQALGSGDLKEANKFAGEAMKLAPGHPDVLYLQGVLDLKERNFVEAQNVLEKATQVDPSHAHAFAALGMAFSDQGKYDLAISPLEQSLKLDANSGYEAHWALAKAYYHQQQYDAAVSESQVALNASNGKAPEIEMLLAQSLTAAGKFEDAAQTLRNFIKNHADRPEVATARRWLERLTADGKISKQ